MRVFIEEELKKSGEAFKTLFNLIPDPVVIVDGKGNFLAVNNKVGEETGFKREELLGKNFLNTKIVTVKSKALLTKNLAKVMTGIEIAPYEIEALTKDGKKIPAEGTATKIEYMGKPAVIAVFRDISERKRIEEELRRYSQHLEELVKERTRRLHESRTRLKNIFAASPDAITVTDLNGNIIECNQAILDVLCCSSKEELIGKNALELIAKKDQKRAMENMKKTLEQGSVRNLEYTCLTKYGREFRAELSTSVIKDSSGNTTGFVVISKDITERKKAEEALRRSEEQARRLLEFQSKVIDTAVVWIDLLDEEGNVTLWNRAAELISGYSREEVVGHKKGWEWLYPDPKYRAEIFADAKKVIERGERVDIDETTIRCKDGTLKTISWYSNAILDERGEPVGSIAVGVDVTEIRKVQEKVRESEEKYRNLFENARDLIFTGDLKGNITSVNRVVEEYGFEKDEIIGKNMLKFVPKKYWPRLLKNLEKLARGNRVEDEVEVITPKGKVIVEYRSNPIRRENKVVSFQTILRNITDRKRFEERLSALNTYSRKLNMADSMEEIYELTLDAAEKTLGFEYVDILIIEGKMLCLMSYRGQSKISSLKLPLDGDKGITVRAARTGKPVLVPDISKEKAYVEGGVNICSELAVPIKIGHRVLGVLNVESKELNAFNEKDQELLEILASHAATAISNLEHAKSLETYAREIQESQQRFKGLFLGNPEAAVYLGPDFHILDVNPRFEELFGYSLDEIKGKHIDDVVVPKDKMEEGKMLDKKAREGYVYYDTLRKRKDESLVPVSISAAPLIVEGQFVGVVGVYKDITERKRFEERLSALNTYSRDLNMADSMEEIYRLTLDAMEKILGFEIAAFMLADKDMLCVVDQRGFSESHASLKLPLDGTKGGITVKAAKTGRPVLVPDTRKERDYIAGEPGMRSELAVPIETGHKVLGVLNVESRRLDAFNEKDQRLLEILASHAATAMSNLEYAKHLEQSVEERKRAEAKLEQTMGELARSNAELEQFAYVASHDLQEPLRMVASYVQLLARRYKGKLDADADDFIAYAVDGANYMQRMINDLLVYSRVGTRGKPFEPTDCAAVLDRALTNLQMAVEKSGAVITRDPLPTVMADFSQLVQLFQNLIDTPSSSAARSHRAFISQPSKREMNGSSRCVTTASV